MGIDIIGAGIKTYYLSWQETPDGEFEGVEICSDDMYNTHEVVRRFGKISKQEYFRLRLEGKYVLFAKLELLYHKSIKWKDLGMEDAEKEVTL